MAKENVRMRRFTPSPVRLGLLLLAMIVSVVLHAQGRQFPFPSVPGTLRTPEDRLQYLGIHYWDRFDFRSQSLLADKDVTEQGFVNFLDLLSRMDSLTAARSADAFVGKAFAWKQSADTFTSLAHHYLENPQSPLRNDAVYVVLLRSMRRRKGLTLTQRQSLDYKIKTFGSNLPGHCATDFQFVDRQGKRHRLSDYRHERVLIFFYDPDCDNCHRISSQLSRDHRLAGTRVLAIYPDSDTQHWQRTPQAFPRTWTDGYSPRGEVNAKLLYTVRATPTLMLIGRGGQVELKDPAPEQLLSHLER